MFIQPNSTVVLCNGVPFDKSYNHTVRFDSAANQHDTIFTYRKGGGNDFVLSKYSYQRYDKNSIRVSIPAHVNNSADYLYDINYMMFQNSAYSDKWFYAFVDSVEYINNNCAEVRYTIDVMQTYMFNYRIKQCYVEREHTETDNVGDNLIPENVPLGDEICHFNYNQAYTTTANSMRTIIVYVPNYNEDMTVIQWVIFDSNNEPITTTSYAAASDQYAPSVRNRFGGGVCCLPVPAMGGSVQQFAATTAAIAKIKSVSGVVITTFVIPNEVYNDNFLTTFSVHEFNNGNGINERASFVMAADPNTSYEPKNMKLLQYPFRKLIVTNGNGGNVEYNWELFTDKHTVTIRGQSKSIPQAHFDYYSVMTPDPAVTCYPTNYRGKLLDNSDFESKCTISEFPRQCYSEDSYAAWKGQNSTAMVISTVTGVIGSLARGFTATQNSGKASAAADILQDVGNTFVAFDRAKNTPDAVNVQTSIPLINYMRNRFGFCCYDVGITGEMAKVIDDYFTMYGYAVNKVKKPNFDTTDRRPHWNYIKTRNITMDTERLPAEAQDKIESIYNKGITFWETAAEVGNYSLNNDPT